MADLATMNAGSSFDFAYCTGCRETFAISVPTLGFSHVSLNTYADSPFGSDVVNGRGLQVYEETWGYSDLASLKFGFWQMAPGNEYYGISMPTNYSAYVYGYETPAASLPTTGAATYSGRVSGRVFYPGATGGLSIAYYLFGTATVRVDFAARTVTGQLSNMRIFDGLDHYPWNAASISASLPAGSAQFTGTTATTSASSFSSDLSAAATGTVAARFYGATGQELGLVWTLYDGSKAAVGSAGSSAGG